LTGDAKEIFGNMTEQNQIYNSQTREYITQIQLKSNVTVDHINALKNLYEADKIINEQRKTGFAKFFSITPEKVKNARKEKKTALDKLSGFIAKK